MLLAFNHWAPLSLLISSFLLYRSTIAAPTQHNVQQHLDLRPQNDAMDLVQMDAGAGSGGGGTAEPPQNGTPPGGNAENGADYDENDDSDEASTIAAPQMAAVQSQNRQSAQYQSSVTAEASAGGTAQPSAIGTVQPPQEYNDEDITTRQVPAQDYETSGPNAAFGNSLTTATLNPFGNPVVPNGGMPISGGSTAANGIFGGANGIFGGAATTTAIWNPIGGNTVVAVWSPLGSQSPLSIGSGTNGSFGSNPIPVGANGAPILGGGPTTAAPWYDRLFIQNDPNLAKELPKSE